MLRADLNGEKIQKRAEICLHPYCTTETNMS